MKNSTYKLCIFFLLFTSTIFSQDVWEVASKIEGANGHTLSYHTDGSILLGGGDGNLYRSTDKGETWGIFHKNSSSETDGRYPGILSINDTTIFISQYPDGTLKTTDFGTNWSYQGFGPGKLIKNSLNHIFHIGYFSCDDLRITTNMGLHWRAIDFGCDVGLIGDMNFLQDDSISVLGSKGGIFVSSDQGITWIKRNNWLHTGRIVMTILNLNDSLLIGTDQGIYYSDDIGLNWYPRNNGFNEITYVFHLLETDNSKILAGTYKGIYISTDRGNSWELFNESTANLYVYSILPLEEDRLLCATREGIFEITRHSIVPREVGINDVTISDFTSKGDTVWIGTSRGAYFSTNFGSDWIRSDTLNRLNTVSVSTSSGYILVSFENKITYSTDNGYSWETKDISGLLNSRGMVATNNDIFLGAFYRYYSHSPPDCGIYKSTDKGDSWSVVYSTRLIDPMTIGKDGDDKIYIGGDNIAFNNIREIKVSTDGGNYFSKMEGFDDSCNCAWFHKIKFDSQNNPYICSSEGIYFFDKALNNWSQFVIGQRVYDMEIDEYNRMYAVTEAGIYYSSNRGIEWSSFDEGLDDATAHSIYLMEGRDTLFLGADGGRIYKRSLPIISDVKEDELTPINFEISNYPNPFNPTTKIKFSIPTPPHPSPYQGEGDREGFSVSVVVYDILGKPVSVLVDERKQPGVYEVEFDGSSLPSGVYIYTLRSGSNFQSGKMMLLK